MNDRASSRARRIDASEAPVRPAVRPAPRALTPRARAPRVEMGFGPHLVFDGYGCAARPLADLEGLYRLLDRLPERIRMTKIMPPYVFRHGKPGALMHGISGFVLIAESHISVHTFPARSFVNVDIFSCEDFDVQDAITALRETFAPRRVDWKLLDRGREFPKHLERSRALVVRDRRSVAHGLGLEVTR